MLLDGQVMPAPKSGRGDRWLAGWLLRMLAAGADAVAAARDASAPVAPWLGLLPAAYAIVPEVGALRPVPVLCCGSAGE